MHRHDPAPPEPPSAPGRGPRGTGVVGGADPRPAPENRLVLALVVALAIVTGAMDAMSFLRLGQVFTSVMTGNLVQLGISAGTRDRALAGSVGVAIASFAAGVLLGAAVVGPRRNGSAWPPRATVALALEIPLLAAFSAWWILAAGQPPATQRPGLLALAAVAMGVQSATVRALPISDVSSTYLTGTLTATLSRLVRREPVRWRGFAAITGLVVGALCGGVLTIAAREGAPAVPLGVLIAVTVTTLLPAARRPVPVGGGRPGSARPAES